MQVYTFDPDPDHILQGGCWKEILFYIISVPKILKDNAIYDRKKLHKRTTSLVPFTWFILIPLKIFLGNTKQELSTTTLLILY